MQVADWEVNAEDVQIDFHKVLGIGSYSTVYQATWRGLTIAVKYFNPDCQPQHKIHLRTELEVLIRIHHPHIIQVLGVCFDPFMLLLEYMPGGNLDSQLKARTCWWTRRKKISWCKELCLALAYLHERKPEFVIHRDLKPSNILIGREKIIKISDFGISKIVHDLHQSNQDLSQHVHYTDNVGTYLYMAPEVMYCKDNVYDSKVDIWALGLIFFEIFEDRPWIPRDFVTQEEFRMYIMNDKEIHLCFHRTPRFIRTIIRSCVQKQSQKRPTAKEVFEYLTHKEPALIFP